MEIIWLCIKVVRGLKQTRCLWGKPSTIKIYSSLTILQRGMTKIQTFYDFFFFYVSNKFKICVSQNFSIYKGQQKFSLVSKNTGEEGVKAIWTVSKPQLYNIITSLSIMPLEKADILYKLFNNHGVCKGCQRAPIFFFSYLKIYI